VRGISAAVLAIATSLIAACSSAASDASGTSSSPALPSSEVSSPTSAAPSSSSAASSIPEPTNRQPSKVVLVVMENAAYESVIGNQAMPYLNETIVPGALSLSHMQANAHPSLPNYVWMAAGTACGASDDDDWGVTCPSVYDQLLDAGIGWRVYAEGYPGGAASCDRAASSDTLSNDYARKHVPPLLFARTSSGAACTAHVVDFPHDTPADA
jgi:phosphatidylinositol-3-phosphatase